MTTVAATKPRKEDKPKFVGPENLKSMIYFHFVNGAITPGHIFINLSNAKLTFPGNFYDSSGTLSEPLLLEFITDCLAEYLDADLIRNIYSKQLIWGDSAGVFTIYDHTTNKVLGDTSLTKIKCHTENATGWKRNIRSNLTQNVNPHNRERFYLDNGTESFNKYVPPAWKQDYWITGNEPPRAECPTIVMEFLKFFLSYDEPSIEFALQWMSVSLRKRNLTYLTLLGSSGSGKGTISKLLEKVHGLQNSKQIKAEAINARFNSVFAGTTLLTINEITKLSPQQLDSIKLLNESTLTIENKGVDRIRQIDNHLNVIISSNNLDALRITSDDRRFSLLNVSDEKLQTRFPDLEAFQSELNADNTVAQFAAYLWHRPYDERNVYTAFKSQEKADVVQSMSLEAWQEEIERNLVDVFAGYSVLATDLATYIRNNVDRNVTANKIKAYCREVSKNVKFRIALPAEKQTHFLDANTLKFVKCGTNYSFRSKPQDLVIFAPKAGV